MPTNPILICYIGLILWSNKIAAQPCKNLVLEGAGIRGIAYAGAIKYLEEKDLIDGIENVGGTSAGAIAALAVSLGYNSEEIAAMIHQTKIQKFNDGKFFFIGGITRMNRNYGWYRGKAFSKWLERLIYNKTGNPDITFQEMHDEGFKDLYVTATSLNHQKLLIFSYETYPQMKVKDAVRVSMSIPLYFEALIIDSLGHILPRNNVTPYYDLVVDGGLTGNFPIAIFDSLVMENGVVQRFPDFGTVGLRIDSPEQIEYDSLQKGLAPVPISRFQSYIAAFYKYVIENLNRWYLTPADWQRTVSISSGGIGSKIRKLSADEKNLLMDNGYFAMQHYLSTLRMQDNTGL
jgi:NTE family protein